MEPLTESPLASAPSIAPVRESPVLVLGALELPAAPFTESPVSGPEFAPPKESMAPVKESPGSAIAPPMESPAIESPLPSIESIESIAPLTESPLVSLGCSLPASLPF